MELDGMRDAVRAEVQRVQALCLAQWPQGRRDEIEVRFDLSGKSAGQAFPLRWVIRINEELLMKEGQRFIDETVGHEVVHLYAWDIYKASGHRGPWRFMMQQLGLNPERCHNYDVSHVPTRKQKRWQHSCGCGTVWLSTVRHNRLLSGKSQYRCRKCGERVK